ncbi:hypothetical protein HOE39_00275 [Candidatus Woesearchaeota archaeon]|jgi:hypothetical protein|nr:hypothetical protein [Candidatus Woesearchaeota archaeon]
MKRAYEGVKKYHIGATRVHLAFMFAARILMVLAIPLLFIRVYRPFAIGLILGSLLLNSPIIRQVYYVNFKNRKKKRRRRRKRK